MRRERLPKIHLSSISAFFLANRAKLNPGIPLAVEIEFVFVGKWVRLGIGLDFAAKFFRKFSTGDGILRRLVKILKCYFV